MPDPAPHPEASVTAAAPPRRIGRTARTLGLGLLLVAVMGAIRYEDDSGLYEDAFWARKKSWKHRADMVIAGDSRAYIALAPMAMQEDLPGQRILNFGFNATGYSAAYLEATRNVLDPESRTRRILFCIAPFGFTGRGALEHGYNEFFVRQPIDGKWQRFLYMHCSRALWFFEPMDVKDLWYGIWPQLKKRHFYKEFHADGWCGFRTIPAKPRTQLVEYKKMFRVWQVEEQYIRQFLDFTRACIRQGIRVYAVRVPPGQAMYDLENELSGFDEDTFVKRFEAAGGHWLDADPGGYETFDDSHLKRDAARRLSVHIAAQIRAAEATE